MLREEVKGFFGQTLNVGDHVVVMCKSGNHYLRECNIHSVEYEEAEKYDYRTQTYQKYERPVVKIEYMKKKQKWIWDSGTQRGHYVDIGMVRQISRIYNWETAITL